MRMFKRFLRDERGATAIECGLIVAGIAVSIISAVDAIGGDLRNTFANVSDDIGNAGQ
jgi:pilus assembly protein Flp/PilA